jgi:4-amino-4-deoxy-L-arabinose transferase-like glycosyltransferase
MTWAPVLSTALLHRVRGLADRHHAILLALTLSAAFAMRVRILIELRKTLYGTHLMPDEDVYHRWAAGMVGAGPVLHVGPDLAQLPAAIFASIYAALGVNTLYLRALNVLLGVVVCVFVYAAGRILYGKHAGLLAALLCALAESVAFSSATILTTQLGLASIALAMALASSLLMKPHAHQALKIVAFGATVGLIANLRANAAILGLLAVPIIVYVHRGSKALPREKFQRTAILLACLGAGYVVCAQASGSLPGPLAGFNLYAGNNAGNPTPYYRPVPFSSSAPEAQALGFIVEASRRAGQRFDAEAADAFWIDEVRRYTWTDPEMALRRLGDKALAIISRSTSDNNHDLRLLAQFVPSLGWPLIPTWFFLAFGIACASVVPGDRRLLAGALGIGLYSLSLLVFFVAERLRAPLLVLLAPFAGGGIHALLARRTSRQPAVVVRGGSIFVVLALLSGARLPGSDDLSGPYNMHALMLVDAGDLEGAQAWYSRSLGLDGQHSAGARIGLAAILQRRGRVADAAAMLEPIPDSYYEVASKYEWLGNLSLQAGRYGQALAHYQASIAHDSSRANAYKGIYIVHRLRGEVAPAAAAEAQIRHLLSFQ